jgi:hypothetical protein
VSTFASGAAADRPSPSRRLVSGCAAISRTESMARSRPAALPGADPVAECEPDEHFHGGYISLISR